MAEIKLMTFDKKEVSFKPELANFSDTIRDAYEADKAKPIDVIFDEKVAIIIKKYLDDHEYNDTKMTVKVPPRSW